MKYLSLLCALAIVYFVANQMASENKSVKSSIAEAEKEAAKVNPQHVPLPNVGATPAAKTALGAPIQRAKELQSIIKQRNADADL